MKADTLNVPYGTHYAPRDDEDSKVLRLTADDPRLKCEMEVAADALCARVFNDDKWDQNERMIANVFKAHYTSAFTAQRVARIADALWGADDNLSLLRDMQPALTRLARRGILRSRRGQRGERLYELNY